MSKNEIGERIKELRGKQNLTQKEFAEKVGISVSAISGYEIGAKLPSADNVIKICETFNCSADWLLGTMKRINTIGDLIQLAESITLGHFELIEASEDGKNTVITLPGTEVFEYAQDAKRIKHCCIGNAQLFARIYIHWASDMKHSDLWTKAIDREGFERLSEKERKEND